MTKKDEVVAAEAVDAAPETPVAASSTAEEEEEEDIDIEAGYLNKKGSNPLNPWNKRYFAFSTEPVALANLQGLHKRNERRVKATPSPTPTPSKGKEPAKDAPSKEGEPAAAAAAAAPAPTVAEVYEEANKDLLVNIAHATTKGEGLLFYHKSDDELHRQNPLGIINLRDVNAVSRVEKSSKNRSFVVSTKNRDYHFSAESPGKAKGWVKAIQEKADEAKASKDPAESPEFQEVYKKLVAREAFEHAKSSAAIVSDADINSDGEPDDIEIEGGKPIVKKRKSFFAFGAVETSHVKTKEGGITTEVSTEQHKDLTHVQEGDVDALKTHESSNAVAHTTDAVASPAAPTPAPKAKSGGFKLFGKKSPKTEEPPAPAPTEHPLTVDEAKAEALKAVDDAVDDSKAKAAAAKADADHPPAPAAPEKKPGFLANLFSKKPVAPPAPAPVHNEETIVVSSENNLSDVVTSEGEATSQSSAGFFSRLSKGKDKNEVEVKSSEVATEDVVTAEGSTHVEHVEGTDANVIKSEGENVVDLSTTDETIATADKVVERKPSLLKRLGDAVRPSKAAEDAAPAAAAGATVAEEPTAETEAAVEDTKVADVHVEIVVANA
ncbi:hypothetical protein BGZ83_006568 [Gryganskiella cystojenkinii]|nr:hypothetical protein BGZ83_006568 [Gryganskiella cystojenkinii]